MFRSNTAYSRPMMKRQRRWRVVEGCIVSPCAYLKPVFDGTLAPSVSLHREEGRASREGGKDIEPTPSSPLRNDLKTPFLSFRPSEASGDTSEATDEVNLARSALQDLYGEIPRLRSGCQSLLRSFLSTVTEVSRFLVPTLLRGHEPKATDEVNAEEDAPASDWRRRSVAVVHSHGGPWERASGAALP